MPRHRWTPEEARRAGQKSKRRKGTPGTFGRSTDPKAAGSRGRAKRLAAINALREELGPLETQEDAERWGQILSDPKLPTWLWLQGLQWWTEKSEPLLRKLMERALSE